MFSLVAVNQLLFSSFTYSASKMVWRSWKTE